MNIITLKKALHLAKSVEIMFHPENATIAQVVITKKNATRILGQEFPNLALTYGDPAYGSGDYDDQELLWYGKNGEIIATYNTKFKTLLLGV